MAGQLAQLFEAMKGADLEVAYDDDGSYMVTYRNGERGSFVSWDFFPNGNVVVCLVNGSRSEFAFSLRDFAEKANEISA